MTERWLIRLYPRHYRAQHAAEIAATYSELTADAGRLTAAREAAGIAGHALRLRTGVNSARTAGRLLTAVAPYVIAVAGAFATELLAVSAVQRQPGDVERTYTPIAYVPWIAVLVCTVAGRWTAVRISAIAAVVGGVLAVPMAYWSYGAAGAAQNLPLLAGFALVAAVVLAVPPDLPPVSRRARATAGVLTAVLGVPLVVGSLIVLETFTDPYTVVPARLDPIGLFMRLAPVILMVPATLALARPGRGGWWAALLGAASLVLSWNPGITGTLPYAAGELIVGECLVVSLICVVVHLVRGLRLRVWNRL